MSDLTKLAEHILERATHIVTEHHEELEPIWFMASDMDTIKVIKTPWGDDMMKEAFLFAIRQILKDNEQIKFYVQVSEGWSSNEINTPEHEKELPPKDRSNCREIIIITGCTRDYLEQILWTAPITTLESGRRTVGAVDKSNGALAGRFINLFPRILSS